MAERADTAPGFRHGVSGNMGYSVAARYRRKGYATEMVRQALVVCRRVGLTEILVTCDEGNVASRRIIERFGGRYENSVVEEGNREMVRRYWIRVGQRGDLSKNLGDAKQINEMVLRGAG